MKDMAPLLRQRARGEVDFRFGVHGVERLREQGCSKIRIPPASNAAILINTSGGLAGGDELVIAIEAAPLTQLSITSQAAERCYASLGPAASLSFRFTIGRNASLLWLPHETILYNRSQLERHFDVQVEEGARFTACEAVVLGRLESGEVLREIGFRDGWNIRRNRHLLHADRLAINGAPPLEAPALAGQSAFATLIHIAPDAESRLQGVRHAIGRYGGASAWNGKLVARLLAGDGLILRKVMKSAIIALSEPAGLPRTWA